MEINQSSVLLSARQLSKSFYKNKNELKVIQSLDFEIREGEMLAIMGASGAGKSTLMHLLGTLERPDSGSLIYGPTGQDILNFSDQGLSKFRNEVLGFVFQFHYLLPEFNTLENVMMPGLIAGRSRSEVQKDAKDLLEFVGLGHRLDHRPSELSGGEQQRVSIARAVIMKPKLILADELTGNLDSANSDRIMNLLIDLNKITNVSILLVTHDAQVASRMQRILTMKDGQFV